MALGRLIIILTVVAAAVGDHPHEVEAENKAKKALEAEKEQRARSASKGSMHALSELMMNRTSEDRRKPRRGKNFNKLLGTIGPRRTDDMMNDNEGSYAMNQKTTPDNDSDSLTKKMKELRGGAPTYEAVNKYSPVSQATGVFCNFEVLTNLSLIDLCMWQWNSTVSSHGLGFRVATAEDVRIMNETTRGLKFSGPKTDADGNVGGHFLYLPVDPTMENMVIKSPPFRGLWEFCKFEAKLHQSKMQNASIRLVSESTMSEVQWILQEVAGNNFEEWYPMQFMIGKVLQEVRIIVEITRPAHVSLAHSLPHIAIDNIRMVECLPEPPVFNGECLAGQLKCKIMNKDSCIKLQQVCDLVKDCDDGTDESKNCDKMPYGSYCNFELDSCGFENIPQPILKWSRHNGPTPTDKTGPNYDHTCGPPDPYPTQREVFPPLIPAHMNFSLSQCVGYYFFVNMNVTGPNKEKADFASTAVMRTLVFNPPPKVHGNMSSKYYNCCMIRFYYQQNGRNYGSLSVDVVELTSRGNHTTSLWFSTKDKGENWYRASIFLPNVTRRYYLQFKTRMGMRIYSDSAIDDFSMAPECFGLNVDPEELGDYNYYDPVFEEKTTPHPSFADEIYYRFTTCGATGRYGPNQSMCDAAYNHTPVSVAVVQSPPYQGIQVWEVPAEGLYTIIATGASGGLGSGWAGVSHGAQARGLFELYRNSLLTSLFSCRSIIATGASGGLGPGWAGVSHGAQARGLFELYRNSLLTSLFSCRSIIATGASGGLGSGWAGVSHGAQARGLFELYRNSLLTSLFSCRSIIATGASGGLGSGWAGVSHGAQARGLFELHRSEHLYMLVGQQGLNACKKTLSAQESQECSKKQNDTSIVFTSKTHEVRNTHVTDGGGGGGGGTYVFLLDKEGQAVPLLVAGGGGGISVGVFRDDGSQHARPHTNATPESGYMYGQPGKTSGELKKCVFLVVKETVLILNTITYNISIFLVIKVCNFVKVPIFVMMKL
ncbi:unnamed protein product [Chilo suppressalis]|uniref:receptor protein-tyrosine kinase n=1 Tax=Chilo suppressalis TaxID=168631 RepID=A0ABN8B3D1_CHISP|nr:unnamed protein product [Chilo suppressalis]